MYKNNLHINHIYQSIIIIIILIIRNLILLEKYLDGDIQLENSGYLLNFLYNFYINKLFSIQKIFSFFNIS